MMARTNRTFKLLGTVRVLSFYDGRDAQWSCFIGTDDPRKLDWNDIPPELAFEGKKLCVCVGVEDCRYHAFTSEELRQLGTELCSASNFPLTTQLKELRGQHDRLKRRYQEDLAGKPGQFVFTFQKGGPRNELQASDITPNDQYRRVFVLHWNTIERCGIKEGSTWVCSWKRTIRQDQPQGTRRGFMLVEVSALHEHFDPDKRIQELEQAIANGAR